MRIRRRYFYRRTRGPFKVPTTKSVPFHIRRKVHARVSEKSSHEIPGVTAVSGAGGIVPNCATIITRREFLSFLKEPARTRTSRGRVPEVSSPRGEICEQTQLFRNSSYYLERRPLCAADQPPRRELSAPNLLLCSNSDAKSEVSSGSTTPYL